MTTRLSLHAAPSAGFDQPFEMLRACHERVERMLGLLERLERHLATAGCDDAARQAAQDVMRYFDLAGPAHHEDEEQHVLPLLAADPDPALRALAARLRQEHLCMAQQWRDLRTDLAGVVDGQAPAPADTARAARWRGFAALYREHLRAEEERAYPPAQARLDAPAQTAMGGEMAARRGAAKV
ncbi:MAG TPA: hemerythrin domain-containing protein [Methylibium sp.]|nr:hemerythrin domain-containing protein [Methylibium sp.]